MRSTVRLALLQMAIENGNIAANRAKAASLVRSAANGGAELIALPEYFLTIGSALPKEEICEPIPGPATEYFGALARELRVHIILGSIVERSADGRLYNTSVVLDDSGSVVCSYRKNHLWCSERATVEPGCEAPLASTPWGPLGVIICWDLAFPALTQRMARAGARLIVCCAHWQENDRFGPFAPASETGRKVPPEKQAEERFVDACCAARAVENGIAFAFVNAWGINRMAGSEDRRIGRSQIVMPFSGRIALARDNEDIVIADVDLGVADTAAAVYGLRGQDWR